MLVAFGCSPSGGGDEEGRPSDGDGEDDGDSDVPNVPRSPSDLEAVAGPEDITLSWRDNSNNESGFRIYFRDAADDDAQYAVLVELGVDVTQFYLPVGPEQYFEYYVVAFNSSGESSPSNTDSARTRPLDPVVTHAECDCQGLEWCKIIVSWQDSRVEEGYEVYINGDEHCTCVESCLPCECSAGTYYGCWVATERFWPFTSNQIEVRSFNQVGEGTGYGNAQCGAP